MQKPIRGIIETTKNTMNFKKKLNYQFFTVVCLASMPSHGRELNFTGGTLTSAANWEIVDDGGTALPTNSDDEGTIEVDGFIGGTTVNWGASTVTMTAGLISTNADNNNINFTSPGGTFIMEGGRIETRGIFANTNNANLADGENTEIQLLGGSVQLGTTSNASVRIGSVNDGSMIIGGNVIIDADQAYTISTDGDDGSLTFLENWTGSWRHPEFTGDNWETTIDALTVSVGETEITAENFSSFFNVSDDGTTLTLIPVPATSDLLLTISPNDADPSNYDFAWNSEEGSVYDLVSSTDLAAAIESWPIWEGNSDIPAAAPSNTLIGVDGGGDERRFFAIIER